MLHRTIKRLIERGMTAGLSARIDVLYAAGKLTDDEYNELTAMLEASNE